MEHMSIEIRESIENLLKERKNFSEISKLTGYHRTTIANEIIKHRVPAKVRTYGVNSINCKHERNCDLFTGAICTKKCSSFELQQCDIITKPPYVCNGCSKKQYCKFQKYFYRAKEAHEIYLQDLKDARSGLNIPEEIINQINEVIAPLIKEKHQTVNQVYINHPDILCFSKSEFYRLINLGYVNIKNIDLPRQVKYRKRKKSNKEVKKTRKESIIRVNRTYNDYLDFIKKNPLVNIIQMDTVEGIKGGKVFFTIYLVKYKLMFIYLLDTQTSEEVSEKLKWIQNIIGTELYSLVFKCGLTDNGHEFYQPEVYETINNIKVCNLFYCDPSSPYQIMWSL